ncbi:MAG: sn-glycerol-1-phosphate dehydrogenase [Oscillospiraceae bacterium]
MKVDLSIYDGVTACGKDNELNTRIIKIEPGAVNSLPQVAEELGLGRSGVIICDSNTKPYADQCAAALTGWLLEGASLIELNPAGLHADEKATAAIEEKLSQNAGWLLAAGSGTIHDATRYVANARGIPFLSFPTAASVDGFVSTVSAMTWYGFKKTLPGVAPLAVIADTDIFGRAPKRLTAAGIGDALGKLSSLADWQIGHLLTGEGFCEEVAAMTRRAGMLVFDNMEAMAAGSPEAMEQLMYALLLSGLGMQLWGNSRPASAAEHHLSHLWEMHAINPDIDALHGEKVGVGLLLTLGVYRKLAETVDISPLLTDYNGLPTELLRESFGPLYDDILEENSPDILRNISKKDMLVHWGDIRRILADLPDPEALRGRMEAAGCPVSMEALRLNPAIRLKSLRLSPFVRARLTAMRVAGNLLKEEFLRQFA